VALVSGNRLEHDVVQPDGHFRVVTTGCHRVTPIAPGLIGQHLAIGQLAREQLVQRHAQCEQIASSIGLFNGRVLAHGCCRAAKAPLLGVDVAWRASVQAAHAGRFTAGQCHPQVKHPQHAVVALVQVGRFDVTVNNTLAVQQTECPGRLAGHSQRLRHAEAMLAIKLLLQRFTAMPAIQQVKGGCRLAIWRARVKLHKAVRGA